MQIGKLIILLVFLSVVLAKFSEGKRKKNQDFVFLEKFCFDESGGSVNISVSDNEGFQDTIVALFADTETSWPAVIKSENSCEWKLEQANAKIFADGNSTNFITSKGVKRSFKVLGARPRWWYLVVANCNQKVVNVDFRISFQNSGGLFEREFSKDAQGIYQMAITLFVFLSILCLLQIYLLYVCKKRKFHTKIIFYILSALILKITNILFILIHLIKFAIDGVGVSQLDDAALFFNLVSQAVYLGIIVVLMKGWPISTNFIYGKRLVVILLISYLILELSLYIWWLVGRDPAKVLFLYDSPPGYALVIARVLAYFWAMKELQVTFKYETEPLKRLFYIFMSCYGTFWFLSVPTSTLAAHFIPDWKRERIITGINLVIDALTFSILAWMFRPSKGNKYFSVLDPNLQVTFGTNQLQIFPESVPPSQL